MRYVSAYRRSASYAAFFRTLRLIVLLAPPALILFSYSQQTDPAERAELLQVLPWVTLSGLVIAWLLWRYYQRALSLDVEIDERGIRHHGPGKPKTLLWNELVDVRVVKVNKNERALAVRDKVTDYLFLTHLVPDAPDAPELRFGIPRPTWIYPDGRREPADIEHSFGYQAVEKFRPDLLVQSNLVQEL